jgi:nucleoside-diphosphate-sugar epimerase
MSMAWKDEKILVTGGSGFLGANLIRLLVRNKGAPPGSMLSLSHRPTHALDDLPDVEQRFGDIADETIVGKACEGRTIVFHTAGSTTFDPRLRK